MLQEVIYGADAGEGQVITPGLHLGSYRVGPVDGSIAAGGGQGWFSHTYDHRASSPICLGFS